MQLLTILSVMPKSHPWIVISSLLQLTHTVYILDMTLSFIEYPFCHFGSAVFTMLHLSFLCTSSLAEGRKLKSPWLRVSTAQEQLKHQCATQHLILHPKFSTGSATEKIWTLFLWKPGQQSSAIVVEMNHKEILGGFCEPIARFYFSIAFWFSLCLSLAYCLVAIWRKWQTMKKG